MFISFEGCEGSGKTTQAKRLHSYLSDHDIKSIFTREPGGTQIAEQIRDVLLDKENHLMQKKTELLLYMACRAQHTEEKIRPAINKGVIVICDRYIDSSTAYQGFGRDIGYEEVAWLNNFAASGLKPDITFYIDVDPEIGLDRIHKRYLNNIASKNMLSANTEKDRIESEDIEFHEKIRNSYLHIADKEPNRFIIIDGSKTIESVWKDIINEIKRRNII